VGAICLHARVYVTFMAGRTSVRGRAQVIHHDSILAVFSPESET